MKIDETLSILDSTLKDFLTTKIQVLTDQLPNLEYVILFGSYARIEQTIKSDIDLLAATSGTPDRLLHGDLCSTFEEANIDLIFYDVDTFRESNCLFVTQVKKECVILWKKASGIK